MHAIADQNLEISLQHLLLEQPFFSPRTIVHTLSPLPSTCYKMKIRKIGSESMTISNNSDVSTLKTRGAKLEQIRHARLIFGEDRGGHEMGRVPRVMTQEEDKYKDRSPKRFRAYATPCSSPGSRLPLRGLWSVPDCSRRGIHRGSHDQSQHRFFRSGSRPCRGRLLPSSSAVRSGDNPLKKIPPRLYSYFCALFLVAPS